MKIIHTADWHLNDKLGDISRTEDLRRRVEQVAEFCEQRKADVLVVAGDLFYEYASLEQMTDSLSHVRRSFDRFLGRGGTIIAITGNHDRDGRIDAVRVGMELAAPPTELGGAFVPGRMYLVNSPFFGRLRDPSDGFDVQFVLLPYPTKERYLVATDKYVTKEEENRLLQARVAEWLAQLSAQPGYQTGARSVLVAHLHVRGSEMHTLYHMRDSDDLIFDDVSIRASWDYVALGHIHKPQAINGLAHVRYPGPLDRLDFGEKDDPRGVLLVEIGREGRRGDPEWLPLEPTPMVELTLADPDQDLQRWRDEYPQAAAMLAKVAIRHRPEQGGRNEVLRRLKDFLPRIASVAWEGTETASAPAERSFAPRADFRSSVREYLERRLADDPDKDAVLALADSFLAPEASS
jgi:DNA repair protein SbcD/Mre11